MQNESRDFTGGSRESSSPAGGIDGRGPESPGEGRSGSTSNTFIQQLEIATSRAFERRLGRPPSQADVYGVVNTLTSRSSHFMLCAERAQARLARLHSELQKSQEQQSRIDITLELTASSIGSSKRPLEEPDYNSPRELKRARLERGNPNPRNSPPPPPFKPENAVQAPSPPMVQKHASSLRGSHEPAGQIRFSLTDPCYRHRATNPTGLSKSNSDRKIERRIPDDTVDAVLSCRPFASQGLRCLRLWVPAAVGLPACTLPQVPPSVPAPRLANVPGIWAIQVGKPSPCQIDLSFEVDQDTAVCVRRWASRRQSFEPYVRHVVVHLVALHATAVSAAQKALSECAGSLTPQAFALALHDLQPQWPSDGTLVLQLNAGQPVEQSWFASDMSAGKSLDVSGAVLAGTNTLRILQLRNMAELVFALYATQPTAEMQDATIEMERQRKIYSYRRPHSERLLD
ncbi:hypothetical protein EI94DRAFT_1797315 [Lactarius quietus]|nr:hypothetical protein EI94DRAFT_1797315 [Lactarius quietus]